MSGSGGDLLKDALWRLDVAERALKDARQSLDRLADAQAGNAVAPEVVPPRPETAPVSQPIPAYPQRQQEPVRQAQPLPYASQVQVKQSSPKDRESMLIRAVAIGGTLITLAGVAFLVAVAIQAGLLGPVGRVVLAYAVAIAAGAAAWRFRSSAPPAAVTALLATSLYTGLATTFLTVTWLGWLPGWLGAVIMTVIYGSLGYYGQRYAVGFGASVSTPAWLAVGAAVAAFFYPMVLHNDLGALLIVLLPLQMTALSVLHRDVSLRLVTAVAWVSTMLGVSMGDGAARVPDIALMALCLAVAIGLVAITVFAPAKKATVGERGVGKPAAVDGDPALLVGGIVAPALLIWLAEYNITDSMERWFVVLALGVMTALAWEGPRVMRRVGLAALPVYFGVAFQVIFWDATGDGTELFTDSPLALLLLPVVFFAAFALLLRWLDTDWLAAAWMFGTVLVCYPLFVGTVFEPDVLQMVETAGMAVIVGAFLAVAYVRRAEFTATWSQPMYAVAVVFALVLSMMAVVGVCGYAGSLIAAADGREAAYRAAHALVSIAWMVLAARLLLRRDGQWSTLGGILAVVAVAKLIFFDMAAIAGLFRAVAFLVSGIVLLVIAVKRAQVGADDERGGQG